jgi:hypothetical protein
MNAQSQSNKTFNNSALNILRSQKVIGIIGGVCAFVVILVAIIAFLSEQPDFSLIITRLGDIRVTPVWPQIGLFTTPIP